MRQLLSVEGLEDNFRFLVMEVSKQLAETERRLAEPSEVSIDAVISRDDFIDNLKATIETKAYASIRDLDNDDQQTINRIRAVNTITSNLERLADFAVNIVSQTEYLRDPAFIRRYDYPAYFRVIGDAVDLIEPALLDLNIAQALKICRTEFRLDNMYKHSFDHILAELRTGRDTENLVTSLFIIRYFERMGDALLNIGEAIISAALGEKLKIDQYEALEESLEAADLGSDMSDMTLDAIWETKSGCRIGRLRDHSGMSRTGRGVIFKDGRAAKLRAEKESIDRWNALIPGLTPRVLDFHERGADATILLENLPARTFQEYLLDRDSNLFETAFETLLSTLGSIWNDTRSDEPSAARFVRQLQRRIEDVYKVHPEFQRRESSIGSLESPSFDAMLERAAALDDQLVSPFSVLVHGDFNIDNVMYDAEKQQIYLIDLHRSRQFDYCQDISVFLVSIFRQPIFEPELRRRINGVALRFLEWSREFAVTNKDTSFEARLTVGLVRSMMTSTRFQLHYKFANAMYLRAVFLLEKLIARESRDWATFRLPDDVLIY